MMKSEYYKKCHGVCPHPHPWKFYLTILSLKCSQVFTTSSLCITSYGFHSNPKQHNDFRALMLQPQDLQCTPGFWSHPHLGTWPGTCSSHLLHTDGLPHTGNKSRRRGAATHPCGALVCPRQTVTRAYTSPQALRPHSRQRPRKCGF